MCILEVPTYGQTPTVVAPYFVVASSLFARQMYVRGTVSEASCVCIINDGVEDLASQVCYKI